MKYINVIFFASTLSVFYVGKLQAVQSAHVHGQAQALIAMDSGALEIEFKSPAMNILGFEHAPQTDQQKNVVKTAKKILETPGSILSVNEYCSLQQFELSLPESHASRMHSDTHSDTNDDEPHEHHHDDALNHDDGEKHGHESRVHEHTSEHSEINARWSFECKPNGDALKIRFSIFENFPALEKISLNWINENSQGATVLDATNVSAELR